MWQYKGAHCWISVPKEANDIIEKSFQEASAVAKFQARGNGFTVDLKSMRQCREDDVSKSRVVRRVSVCSDRINGFDGTAGQWQHCSVHSDERWHNFSAPTNGLIDTAYCQGAAWCRFALGEKDYTAHFQDGLQCSTEDGHTRKIRRVGPTGVPLALARVPEALPDGAPLGAQVIPMGWCPMGSATYLEVELLGNPSHTTECMAVCNYFKKTACNSLKSIKRIQNLSLWQSYARQRDAVKAKPACSGNPNEDYFWHGSKVGADTIIKQGGFDVTKGGGRIWVSTNSKYSLGYCGATKHMMLARVTLGYIGTDSVHCGMQSTGHVRKDDQVGGGSDNRYTIPHSYQLYPSYILSLTM